VRGFHVPRHTELDRLAVHLTDERAITAVQSTFVEWLIEKLPEHPGLPGVVSAHDDRDIRVEP
jgi:hypothetical protein